MKQRANPHLQHVLAACRRALVGIAGLSLFINLLMLTAPLYMMQIFDRVLVSRSSETLVLLTVIAGAALLTMGLLEALRSAAFVRLGAWVDDTLGAPMLTASVDQALGKGTTPSVQGLRDIATVRGFLGGPSVQPFLDAPWTPIFAVLVFLLHPVLGWVALAGAVVLFSLALANEALTRRELGASGAAAVRALQEAETAVRNADAIEAMGMLPAVTRRWYARNAESLALQQRAGQRGAAITALSKMLRMSLQIGLFGAGAYLVLQAELSPGSMIAASILMGRALAPVEQAIGAWRSAIAALGAYRRVRERLLAAPPRGEAMTMPEPTGQLRVETLDFRYPGRDRPTLRNIGFALEPGESLGLIGPSASGKSTLARMLVGNLRPLRGYARLDGVDLASWEPDDRGRYVGYLPQDVELLAGTVAENIARMGEVEPDAVVAAARLADAHDMITGLPKGYDTEVGADGAVLSGGQRQRVALARAVFGTPRLVVLDEPNAFLDRQGEDGLAEAIARLKQAGVTVVAVTHRPSLLERLDKVLILREGAVQKFGPVAEVIPELTAAASRGPRVVVGGKGDG